MIEKLLSHLWLWLFATAAGVAGVTQLQRVKEIIAMAATDPVGIASLVLFFVGLAGLVNAIRLQAVGSRSRKEQQRNVQFLLEAIERVGTVIAVHGFAERPDTKESLLAATDELRRARQALERALN